MIVKLVFNIPDEEYDKRMFGYVKSQIEFLLKANCKVTDIKWEDNINPLNLGQVQFLIYHTERSLLLNWGLLNKSDDNKSLDLIKKEVQKWQV